ncbi:MAG: MFS transporter, partial [Nitrospinota bacterium]
FLLAPGPHFPLFALLRLVQGTAFALAFTGSVVVATEAAPKERRAQAFGLLGMVAPLAQALAPRLGEALVGVGGYPLLFASALGWAGLGAVVCTAAWRGQSPDGARSAGSPRPFGGPTFGEPSAFALARRRDFRANLFAGFCFGFAFGAVLTFVPLAIRGAGLPAVGFFFTMQGAMVALTRLTLGSLADRFGKRRVILPALALLGASMVLLAAAHTERGFAAGALLMGFSHGLLFPAMMALAVDRAEAEEAGSVVALFGGAFNLGMLVSGFSLGPVAEAFGFAALFGLAAALTWAGFLAFLLGDPRN